MFRFHCWLSRPAHDSLCPFVQFYGTNRLCFFVVPQTLNEDAVAIAVTEAVAAVNRGEPATAAATSAATAIGRAVAEALALAEANTVVVGNGFSSSRARQV